MMQFYSNGKLLLSAEYTILDGALALALPTKYGQSLQITPTKNAYSVWKSYDANGALWYKGHFTLTDFEFSIDKDFPKNEGITLRLQKILKEARKMNTKFLSDNQNYNVITKLSFSRHWGLGSSSTLINNIAQWAQIDAFNLQFKCFGGSGYDVACAQHNQPILYRLRDKKPTVETVNFNPSFKNQLYFVYLNKKQNSREGIEQYQNLKAAVNNAIFDVSEISTAMLNCTNLADFEALIIQHEAIISKLIKIKPIKEQLFDDYFGSIKSLGAWGGDFVLATGNSQTPTYFKNKGFNTVIPFQEMVLIT
jgi:mevalonate kinase